MATPFDPSKLKMSVGPRGASRADIVARIRAYPGVLEFDLHEDHIVPGKVNVDLKLVERPFDMREFIDTIRECLPVACTLDVSLDGQVDRSKPNPFENIRFQDYDEDMSDAELAYRLKTLRG